MAAALQSATGGAVDANNPVVNAFLGSDAATISNLITGPDRAQTLISPGISQGAVGGWPIFNPALTKGWPTFAILVYAKVGRIGLMRHRHFPGLRARVGGCPAALSATTAPAICISSPSAAIIASPGWRGRRRRDQFLKVFEQVRQRYSFVVVGYVVMPEYVHLLISEPEKGDPSRVVQAIKQGFARLVLRLAGRGSGEAE